jgi:NAD(P)-dependent dehydrogenase (short-subunit alcohol dehydrogenase family)
MFDLTGKTAVITGTRGLLGRQFTIALADQGANIIGIDIRDGQDVMSIDLPDCDILVNNARTDWQGMARLAMQMKRGSVINIASVYSVVAPDFRIYDDTEVQDSPIEYTATKSAVLGITKYLAVSLAAKGVRVNSISPGGVENGHSEQFVKNYSATVPMGRMADPADMNGAVVFLASDASKYMTGQNLIIDGGKSIW